MTFLRNRLGHRIRFNCWIHRILKTERISPWYSIASNWRSPIVMCRAHTRNYRTTQNQTNLKIAEFMYHFLTLYSPNAYDIFVLSSILSVFVWVFSFNLWHLSWQFPCTEAINNKNRNRIGDHFIVGWSNVSRKKTFLFFFIFIESSNVNAGDDRFFV